MNKARPRYIVDRSTYSLDLFNEEYEKKNRSYPVGGKARKLFSWTPAKFKALIFSLFPILTWVPKYKIKEYALPDVLGGISAGTIQVPQGMAFALLANLPPVNGLYSSFYPLVIYFFLGGVPQMVPGTFAVISIIVGNVCMQLAPESDYQKLNETTNATITDTEKMNMARLQVSATLACLTAIIQIALGFVQFGFVAIYLSESFIRGFMTAAGLQILISVLKYIFGITVPPYSGPLAIIYTFIDICKKLPHTNVASLIFALVSIVLLIVVKELNLKYMHKIRFPIPMEIIIVIIATAVSGNFNLPDRYHMNIVGQIPLGFPSPTLPTVSQWGDMIGTAFSLAIVGYVINLAMGRTLGGKHGYDVDPNQEMLALGCSNFFGSFFFIHVICCALSVTLAVDGAGGKSQMSSFFVMMVVMVTMLALGTYLQPLPKAVLGALIAVNLKNSLKQLADPFYLWKKSKLDCTGLDPCKVYLAKKKYLKKHEAEELKRQRGSVFMKSKTLSLQELQEDFDATSPTDSNNNSTVSGTNSTISYIASNTLTVEASFPVTIPNGVSAQAQTEDPIIMAPPIVHFHTVIIDMSGVCFVDLMGIKALGKLCSSYQRIGVNFYLADVQAQVYDDIELGGVFAEGGLSHDHLFLTIHDAVLYALANNTGTRHIASEKGSGDTEICVQDTQDEISEDYPNLEEAMFGSMFQAEIQTAL
ncbi:solute carrier family 26 member 9 isoform X2 [Ranitomeya imitator]|uniref:solute carrier family 26 member 9 isoform X2 n=1 Tax=Ranitomeya imitator TaxID=111125 RepID=UPI0037E8100D